MPQIDLNDLAKVGVIKDEPGYQLPPEVWTTADNWRSRNGGMEVMLGSEQVFGTPSVAPHFAFPVSSSSQNYWIYTSLTKAYVYDGTNHTDITRAAGGDYTATETRQWNGTLLGGVPLINNGVDKPQFWASLNPATDLADLTNWPATLRTAVLRSFGPYLFALNNTLGGTNYPHQVRWSQSVTAPGTVPASWDDTDESIDAGSYDLVDVNAGVIRDALRLGSKFFIYKEGSIWAVRFVGGRAVFAFDTFLETAGILAPRCVAITGDGKKHVVATQDDIIIHNGQSDPVSVIHGKLRKSLFNDLDSTNYLNSFMFTDAEYDEVLFCYPQSGQTNPNRAVVFNYRTGAVTETDVYYRNAAAGRVEVSTGELWSDGTDVWDDDTGPWSTQERRRVILCDPANTKFYKNNSGYKRNGVAFTATLQRVGLSLVGKKRSGEWIVDHEVMKFIDRMMPKVKGGSIQVRVGTQMLVDGPVTWGPYATFDPSTGVFADTQPCSGRAMCVEFYLSAAAERRLDGYKVQVTPDGEH